VPVCRIEAPPGIVAKKKMVETITAAIDEAYHIGDTLVFLQECKPENVAMDGRLLSEDPNPGDLAEDQFLNRVPSLAHGIVSRSLRLTIPSGSEERQCPGAQFREADARGGGPARTDRVLEPTANRRDSNDRCVVLQRTLFMKKKLSSRMSESEYDKQIALVLQGGGALGSYQAGVYEAMAEHGYQPDWVAGISIGAINSAIIAGNAPEDRVARLREFWGQVSSPSSSWLDLPHYGWQDTMRRLSAMSALLFGQPGFFRPNLLRCWTTGTLPTSYYDTSDLKNTLERLVDFDRINERETRFSVGAVNVRTATLPISTMPSKPSGQSTSSPAARYRPAFPRSKSTANSIGMAASYRIPRCGTFWRPCRGTVRLLFKSTYSPR
jgi:hypothetical protein